MKEIWGLGFKLGGPVFERDWNLTVLTPGQEGWL